jgi:hypothetical protein
MDHINPMHQTPSSHILAFYIEYEPFICNGRKVDVEVRYSSPQPSHSLAIAPLSLASKWQTVIEWEDEWEDCPRSAFNRLFPTHLTPEEVCSALDPFFFCHSG